MSYQNIIRQKSTDYYLQLIIGLTALTLAPFTWLMSLFLLGLTHAISTCYWLVRPALPKSTARRILEPVNVVVVFIFVGGLVIDRWLHAGITEVLVISLLCIGPVLGCAYFILTIRELNYFKRLQQQEEQRT